MLVAECPRSRRYTSTAEYGRDARFRFDSVGGSDGVARWEDAVGGIGNTGGVLEPVSVGENGFGGGIRNALPDSCVLIAASFRAGLSAFVYGENMDGMLTKLCLEPRETR